MIALPLPFPEMPAAPTRPAPTPPPARESTRRAPAPVQRHEIAREPVANPPARRRALWLGVHLLNWPLHAPLSSLSESDRQALSAQPLAIVDSDRRNTLAACNDAALSVGVRPGHSMNAAIALCADLRFLPRHADRERTRLDEIAAFCQRYTSAVTVQPPNELLLEVRGSLRLFGGIHALMSRVRTDLFTQGLRTQSALSATAQSAQWLARTAQEPVAIPPRQLLASLAALPIAALLWPADVELRLRRFGVVTIGDLLRLPRGGLARRIGATYLEALDRAEGRRPEVRADFRAVEIYDDRLALDFEIETTRLLSVVLQRRLDRLQRFLTRRNLALEHLSIELKHRECSCTEVPVGLANPTADMAHVATLVREHLARLQLPAPVIAVRLRVPQLQSARGGTGDLFLAKGRELDAGIAQARLLERLRSRLGNDAIQSLSAHADHRPEHAHRAVTATIRPLLPAGSLPRSPRPLWLLAVARRIRPSALHQDGMVGPEKLASGWWDEQPAARDYYRVRAGQSALGWIYRDCEQANEWRLHGLFG